jgi:hypothetical protein
MTMKTMKQLFSILACSTLLMPAASALAQDSTQNQSQSQQNTSQPPLPSQATPGEATAQAVAPQTPAQLDALVAPIALYPDALVAQVLAACAYPEQVTFADDWLSQNTNLTGNALTQAVDQQPWDPSVKALTQFPSVLHNLAHNLSWTSSLGQAFTNQQADVMAAVQAMRAKAQAAGTLQSTSQITVVQQSPSTIVIQPANPQIVYVPQYNPAVVYGAPVVVPLYVPPPMPVVATPVYFGTGIVIGGTFGGGGWAGGFGWGWHAWNVNWGGGWGRGGGGNIIYNNSTYVNKTVINKTVINRTTNNSYNNNRPGPVNHAGGATGSENRGYYSNNGTYHPNPGYHPGVDTHYGPNGGYHPDGYYGPHGGFHPDVPGTNPSSQPNGGNNGNHGLIGGSGATQQGTTGSNSQHMLGSSDPRPNSSPAKTDRQGSDRGGKDDRNRARQEGGRANRQNATPRPRPQHMKEPHNRGGGNHRR